jgi:galactonate dehydratase
VAWNGILESAKIAAMADAYEVNVAPHNFNGHLGSLINPHMCAVVRNFKVVEIDIDAVKWKDDIVTHPPVIENGDLMLPKGPGWRAEVNEEFVRTNPPRRYLARRGRQIKFDTEERRGRSVGPASVAL